MFERHALFKDHMNEFSNIHLYPHDLGMPPCEKSAVFFNIVQTGGRGVNQCSKIMSEIVVCSGGHLTT